MSELILLTGSHLVFGGIIFVVVMMRVEWREQMSEWRLKMARGVRDEAARLLDEAQAEHRYVAAVVSPTGEFRAVTRIRVRLASGALQRIADWARDVFTPDVPLPDWQPDEIGNLPPSIVGVWPPRPPLRVKSKTPARARWAPQATPKLMSMITFAPGIEQRVRAAMR